MNYNKVVWDSNDFEEEEGIFQLIKSKFDTFKDSFFDQKNSERNKIIFLSLSTIALSGGLFYLYYWRKKYHQKNPHIQMRRKLREKIEKEQEQAKIQFHQKLKFEQKAKSLRQPRVQIVQYEYSIYQKYQNISETNPFLPPYEKGLYISELGKTHRLLFNKFQVIEGHTLVVTKHFEKQSDLLTPSDFQTSLEMSRVQNGFVFYNSGNKAGSSQPHKHLQIMPEKAWKDADLLQEIKMAAKRNQKQIQLFSQFKHVILNMSQLSQIPFGPQEGKYVHQIYLSGLQELENSDLKQEYNLIFDKDFLFIVLRSKERAFGQIAINAMGFTGSFLVKNEDQFQMIQSYTPIDILKEVTVKCNKQ